MSSWVLDPSHASGSPAAGGKARALADAEQAGLAVPPWIVLSTDAFEASLACAGSIERIRISAEVLGELTAAVAALAPGGELLAVRSSAADEDGAAHSFAGQLESCLGVPPEDVPARVLDVWRSAFTDRMLAYRREHALPPLSCPPAVLIQRMVQPRAAGVAFSADPVSGRRGVAVVSAVPGLGSAIVSGEADADTWLVARDGAIVDRRIVAKRTMHVVDGACDGGVRTAVVPEDRAATPALSDAEVKEVAALARASARHFGRPQDIEWAVADRLYLLQSRPITSLRSMPDPDGRLAIWDNSNIVESYSGVTTPLTFSFARGIYRHVYEQFCRMMGVPPRLITEHDETFRNMLGLVRGRMYYNLLNWYRMLALLPGYGVNARFMEQMMGVKEPLPDEAAEALAREARRGRALDALYLVRTLASLLVNHFTVNQRVDAFYRRLDEALLPPDPPLEERRPDELVVHYRALSGKLLLEWDAPLINDFFAMIFYGVLRKLVVKWCDAGGTLQNDLISGEGGIVSAEPAVRMQRMARTAAASPALVECLTSGTREEARAQVAACPALHADYVAYLEKFGDRTVNELKLESTTLVDDPLPLFRAVGALAGQVSCGAAIDVHGAESSGDRLREEAARRVSAAFRGHPARRILFDWVLCHARRRVRDRENLRLERTRLFGRVRRIFLEMGRRFHAADLLDSPRDVFYLEVDEVLSFVDGRATTTNLRGLAALRRAEFRSYEEGPAPDDRFETRGVVHHAHDYRRARPLTEQTGEERSGLGCCPGIVRGPVRVVTDPGTADLRERAILVAAHTDPGWIMVFPSARALLVERGSLLSHAAIVARELGIPAIVSVPGITRWLKDGDWVEMNGSTGVVRRVPAGEDRGQ
jgi:rifampicin phosphotransferase